MPKPPSPHPATAAHCDPEFVLVRRRYVGEPGELLLLAVHGATMASGSGGASLRLDSARHAESGVNLWKGA